MVTLIFSILSSIAVLFFGFAPIRQRTEPVGRILTALISMTSVALVWIAPAIFSGKALPHSVMISSVLGMILPYLLFEHLILVGKFKTTLPSGIVGVRTPLLWIWRLCILGTIGTVPFWGRDFVEVSNQGAVIILNHFDRVILYNRLLADLLVLFVIETVYRYSSSSGRRLGRIAFVAFIVFAVIDAVFSARSLLYSTIIQTYFDGVVIATGICMPLGLWGLTRSRLDTESILISPAGISSSLTLLLAGSLFVGLGLAVMLMQQIGISFTFFEQFLAFFSAAVGLILFWSSPSMRLRMSRFVNRIFYRHRYDYREQFFRLHETYMAGERLEDSVNVLLENLHFGAGIGEAFVFLHNPLDGRLILHQHPGTSLREDRFIRADSPIMNLFDKEESPLVMNGSGQRIERALKDPVVAALCAAVIFPIKQRSELVGILALKAARGQKINAEDLELIRVFAISIGNVFFRYRMLQEQVEMRQFESFGHISSFIVHDIKNQVATLSLTLKNAEKNIANPDFQKSMLHSVQSCSANLQALVDKLSRARSNESLNFTAVDVNPVVNEAVVHAGRAVSPGLTVSVNLKATLKVSIDRTALESVIRNLIINAIESMNGVGELRVLTGDSCTTPPEISSLFGPGTILFEQDAVYIAVSDSGCGMDQKFIDEKLFRPFVSTKDKGIGIGLYQCKRLVEQMGGKLLCYSRKNAGTTFCIILPERVERV